MVARSLLEQIKQDHKQIRLLFSEYKKFRDSKDLNEARKWYHQWGWEVARHSVAEEVVIYPEMKKKLDAKKVEELYSEQQETKEQLSRLESLAIETNEFDKIMEKINKALNEHMQKEEEEQIPEFERVTDSQVLKDLAKKFEHRKKIVPTRPHPNAPTTPYLETLVGLIAAPIDKVSDLFRDYPDQ